MKDFEKKLIKDTRRVPMILILVIALFFAGGSIFHTISLYSNTQTAHSVAEIESPAKYNPIDLHIAPYSDKHITRNAIETNEKFETLALADFLSPDQTSTQFISPQSQIAGAGLALLQAPEQKEYGTWIWTPLLDMTPEYMESIMTGAESYGVNVIYISIDSYLDIFVMHDGKEKEKKYKEFSDKLERFIIIAHKHNIKVDAEAGWRNWAELGNTYKAFAIIQYVKEFNATHTHTLRGFQYDVEPYLLSWYQKDNISVLRNFLSLIDQSIMLLGPKKYLNDLEFSVVIPDFYDKNQSPFPPFEYMGETDYPYNHLLNSLEKRPNSSVIVMSYRNFAHGADGSIDISNTEVETATNGLYSTRVILAQETGDVQPPYITFNNTNKKYYSDEVAKLTKAFEPYANFGGIAVHYVNAFLSLK